MLHVDLCFNFVVRYLRVSVSVLFAFGLFSGTDRTLLPRRAVLHKLVIDVLALYFLLDSSLIKCVSWAIIHRITVRK